MKKDDILLKLSDIKKETSVKLALLQDAKSNFDSGYAKWLNAKNDLMSKAKDEMGLAVSNFKVSIQAYEEFIKKAKEIGADDAQAMSALKNAKTYLSLAEKARDKMRAV